MKMVAKPGRLAAAALGMALAAVGLLASAPAIAAARPQPAGHRIDAPAALPGPGAPWQRALSDDGLTGPGWPQKVPRPGSSSELNAIYCNTVKDCWAVGEYNLHGAGLNQVLHWNGKRWSEVTAPQPGGTSMNDSSELFGVRCLSSKSCWAVGDYEKKQAELSEALRWNGKHWAATGTPSPAGKAFGDFSDLFEPFCASASSCWAVGQYGTATIGSETFLNLVVHWNGRHWAKVTVPNPGGTGSGNVNTLSGIRCTRASNCWAVGTEGTESTVTILLNEALHWNGKHWVVASIPSPAGFGLDAFSELQGLACLTARDCWAVGSYGDASVSSPVTLNQALHWNGKHWAKATTPNPEGTGTGADNSLVNVTCFSSADCWAVGEISDSGSGPFLNEAMQWTGHKWVLRKTPDPGGLAAGDTSSLNAVRCPARKGCWAVGDQHGVSGPNLNQLLRWKGTKWVTG